MLIVIYNIVVEGDGRSVGKNISLDLEKELYLFNKGEHFESYQIMGSKRSTEDMQDGWRFTVWAPNAKAVSLIGDFSNWEPIHMTLIGETGAWSTFVQNADEGHCYKYLVEDQAGVKTQKIDPFALAYEVPPKDASIVQDLPAKK